MVLSICICTYNRADILKECLQALLEQKSDLSEVEILVVDNNSKDHTAEVCKSFQDKFQNFSYILELNQGLSFARNRGADDSSGDWICYLDDDAKAMENYCQSILKIIESKEHDIFGGPCLPWYKYGKPNWYRDSYETYSHNYDSACFLKTNEHLYGSNMIFRKSILEQYGGFNTNLGMRGSVVGYGEENELQKRMTDDGQQLFWDPALAVLHLVPKYKLNPEWFFKSAYSLGKDSVLMKSRNTSILNVLLIAVTTIGMLFIHILIYTPKLLSKNYFVENWLIDVFKKIAKRVGIMYTALTKKG